MKAATVSPTKGAKVSKDRSRSDRHIDPSAIEWAVSFIDRFEKPVKKLATQRGLEERPDGSVTLPSTEYSPDVTGFAEGLHEKHLNIVFDWGKWKRARSCLPIPA